jgi:NTE family protein
MHKTDNNMEMFEVYERYIDPLRKMYQIINAENGMLDDTFKARLNEIEPEEVVRIGRREKLHYLLEDADFSLYRIKKQTSEGEKDPEHILARKKEYDICA